MISLFNVKNYRQKVVSEVGEGVSDKVRVQVAAKLSPLREQPLFDIHFYFKRSASDSEGVVDMYFR